MSVTLTLIFALATGCEADVSNRPPDIESTRAPDTDIAALLHRFGDDDASERRAAADELGENGSAAYAALDELKRATTQDRDYDVRLASTLALWRIEPESDRVVDILQAELAGLSSSYRNLTHDVAADESEDLLDSIFETLQQIQALLRVIAMIGPGASGIAADLVQLLENDIGAGYADLVPDIAYALAAMGLQANSSLPALNRFRGTTRGKQNRDLVDEAIRSLETGQLPPNKPRSTTDVD